MECEYQDGDQFMLFQQFRYNFHSGHLPIEILPTLYFAQTPQGLLHDAPRELAAFVLPGYGLPGMGIVNCCLRRTNQQRATVSSPTTASFFFTFLSALRLLKPLPIIVGGMFRFRGDEDPIADPASYNLQSAWQPKADARYDAADVSIASDITKRTLEIRAQQNKAGPNLEGAIVYFSQVSVGLVQSLQLAYLGLWIALEALFVPPGNGKADRLAARISAFLSGIDLSVDIKDWVKSEYARRRSKFAHGHHSISPWSPATDSAPQAFGRLHEVVRLCLLGFPGMDESDWNLLHVARRTNLQRALDALGNAKSDLITNQVAWLP